MYIIRWREEYSHIRYAGHHLGGKLLLEPVLHIKQGSTGKQKTINQHYVCLALASRGNIYIYAYIYTYIFSYLVLYNTMLYNMYTCIYIY